MAEQVVSCAFAQNAPKVAYRDIERKLPDDELVAILRACARIEVVACL